MNDCIKHNGTSHKKTNTSTSKPNTKNHSYQRRSNTRASTVGKCVGKPKSKPVTKSVGRYRIEIGNVYIRVPIKFNFFNKLTINSKRKLMLLVKTNPEYFDKSFKELIKSFRYFNFISVSPTMCDNIYKENGYKFELVKYCKTDFKSKQFFLEICVKDIIYKHFTNNINNAPSNFNRKFDFNSIHFIGKSPKFEIIHYTDDSVNNCQIIDYHNDQQVKPIVTFFMDNNSDIKALRHLDKFTHSFTKNSEVEENPVYLHLNRFVLKIF